jgi:outer membrane protein assembly factor BamB
VGASPIYWNGHIFVTNWYGFGDWAPGLYSLNAETGEVEWRNNKITGSSTAVIFGNTLVVGNLSGHVYYVNASSGAIEKEILLESSPSWWGVSSSPLVYNSSVYVLTFSNGTLWKLNTDGDIQWRVTTGGEISHYTSPTAYGGRIFFAGNDSGNALFSVYENSTISWKFPVEGDITSTPSVGYGKVFLATNEKLYAVGVDGKLVWSVDFNGTISSPAVANGKIYIGSAEGKLYCFDAENGSLLWTFTANGKIDSSPAVANGVVYFATNTPQGTIYAVNANTGDLLWYYRLNPPSGSYYNIMSSPFIANNKLYIGADSGYVYCFNSSGTLEYNVTLVPTDFSVDVNGNSYNVERATALGALYATQDYDGEVFFEISLDDSWYDPQTSSGLFVSSIMGLGTTQVGGKWIYWSVWNESKAMISVSVDAYSITGNKTIYYCYGDGTSLDSCLILLKINTEVKPAGVSSFEVLNGKIGGNLTAWVNITTTESNWYVVVVSGVNDSGESLAGLSTFYLEVGEELSIPVLVHVPQLAKTGTYRLYAGVYKYSEYPNSPIHVFGYVTAEVS